MLIPIADQRPGIDLHLLPDTSPSGQKYRPCAMESGQGFDTYFHFCDAGEPCGVVCIDGVWHWEIEP